jgi:hypothetical protein
MWPTIIKIVLAIVAIIVTSVYLAPLLVSLFPPFGVLILILIYIGIVYWLLAGPNLF